MKDIRMLKCNTHGANCTPTFPVGLLLRGMLNTHNISSPVGKWATVSAVDSIVSTPAVDFYESLDGYTIRVQAPGFSRQDLNLSYQEGVLTISGKLPDLTPGAAEPQRTYYFRECSSKGFTRSIEIPSQVKTSEIKATAKDGILTVFLPKAEEVKPQKIEVASE